MLGFSRKSPAVFAFVAAVFVALVQPALAGEAVNKNDQNLAILGYDTVAYFTQGKPVEGKPEYEHQWHDATWRFSSAEHRERFAADPQRYAPRYGGFCAGAMALGWRAPIDPEAWVIVEDRLYLNYAKRAVAGFAKNADENIAKADENWKTLGKAN